MLLSLVLHTYSMRYLLPGAVLLGSAPTYVLVWGVWRLLSALLPARVYQVVDDRIYCVYQSMVLFFFEHYTGAQILLYGDLPKNKENIIYLANHQSTVDWIIADILAVRQGALGHVRYVLKDRLKWLPLYGCYFSRHGGIYVKRSAKFSEARMRAKLQSYVSAGTPMYLVIFPEGTRYNPGQTKLLSASQAYAAQHASNWPFPQSGCLIPFSGPQVSTTHLKALPWATPNRWELIQSLQVKPQTSAASSQAQPPDNSVPEVRLLGDTEDPNDSNRKGLPVLKHVLTPRIRATYVAFDSMKDYLDAIYDVTVVYEGKDKDVERREAPSMTEFLCRECPTIHIHIDRVDRKDVPGELASMRGWLHERFEIKDKLLIDFFESPDPERRNKFPGKSVHSSLSLQKTLPSVLLLGGLTAGLLMTEAGRKLYVNTWVCGSLLGCLWVAIRA